MRVITWNVAGRVSRQPEQAQAIAAVGADVVALQEVTSRTLPLWRAALADERLQRVRDGARRAARDAPRGGCSGSSPPRANRSCACPRRPTCRGRSASCAACAADVEVVNLHSPIAPAPDLAKVRTHEALAAYLAAGSDGRGSCAATSTPPVASSPTATCSPSPTTARAGCAPSAASAGTAPSEPSCTGCAPTVGRAFRALHGYGERQASWTFARDRGGWRLDHVLVRAAGRWPAPTRTTGGARPQRPLGPRRRPRSVSDSRAENRARSKRGPIGHTYAKGPRPDRQRKEAHGQPVPAGSDVSSRHL